jgi:membrane protein YqaA with SNARE-associated domain
VFREGANVLTWLGITLGVAFGSALCPLISVEVFLIGLVGSGHQTHMSWWMLGAVIAIGQVVGKLLYYYAGRGALRLPALLRPKEVTAPPRETRWHAFKHRWAVRFGHFRDKCEKHPRLMIGTTGVSALTGLPPFMAITVLAGVVRMSLAAFLFTTLTGRFLRFSAIAASPGLLAGWLPHLA